MSGSNASTRFQPGNPGGQGRTPQSVKLAKRLMAETGDGDEMIQLILGIARGTARMGKVTKAGKATGKAWSEASRRWAIEMVVDRCYGKAKQSIDLGIGPTGPRLNRGALSNEEVAQYQALVRKMTAPIDARVPLELPPSAVTEVVAAAIAADPVNDQPKAE